MRRTFRFLSAPTGAALATLIQELRYRTDAPILLCKKALTENEGDLDRSIAWLKEKGAVDSVKKGGRETAYGILAVCIPATQRPLPLCQNCFPAAVLELAAETDFAVRTEKFTALANAVSTEFTNMLSADEALYSLSEDELLAAVGKRSEGHVKSTISALGENVVIKRVVKMPTPTPGLVPRYVPEGITAPAALTVSRYVHNATEKQPNVGSIVGIAALWSYLPDDKLLPETEAASFAQHLVANMGDLGRDVAQQHFLGTEETVAQWWKSRMCRLGVGLVHTYGAESPQIVLPKPIERPLK